MGIDITNVEFRAHSAGTRGFNTYYFWLHQQNLGLDDASHPECSREQADGIRAAAAQSQLAFNDAVAAIWPIWYAAKSVDLKAKMRACVVQDL